MKVVLLGARGMLARDIARQAPSYVTLNAFDLPEIDLADGHSLERVLRYEKPYWVINAAAYTAVDKAESERDAAFAINGAAVGVLGRLCATLGIRVLHYGTDYVFRGDASRPYRESDETDPVNVYGASKLAGERALLASGAHALILRTQWLFGSGGKSFPRTMWERARAGLATRVVDDQHGCPTYTVDLAAASWALVEREESGLLHATNAGATTWYELARHVFAAAGAPELLAPCSTADYPTPARRPSYSVLDGSALRARGVTMPAWPEAVDRFLQELSAM